MVCHWVLGGFYPGHTWAHPGTSFCYTKKFILYIPARVPKISTKVLSATCIEVVLCNAFLANA